MIPAFNSSVSSSEDPNILFSHSHTYIQTLMPSYYILAAAGLRQSDPRKTSHLPHFF